MLIPESMTIYFLAGFMFGAAVTIFFLFLLGLLYGLNSRRSDHFYADEVDFDEKPGSHWPIQKRLDHTDLYPTQARQRW